MFSSPDQPLNCYPTLDESHPFSGPRVSSISQVWPKRSRCFCVILISRLPAPMGAAWTAWEGPQNSSKVIAMSIRIAATVVTEPPPPQGFLFRGDMPQGETKLLCLFSKFLLTKSLSVDKSNILKISLEVFQVSKINQNQISFWRCCLLSFRKK